MATPFRANFVSTTEHGGAVRVGLEVNWKLSAGDPNITRAIDQTVNATIAACVARASKPSGHPRWRNRTFAAQRSVRRITPAKGRQPGDWGSRGVFYAFFLERNYGPWLRWAQGIEVRRLPARLRTALNTVFRQIA